MKSPLLHIASLVYDNPLAIVPAKLDAILHAVGPRLSFDQSALQSLLESGSLTSNPKLTADFFAFDEDELEVREEKPYKLTKSGIAIVPIRGALMKRGGWMSALSGCSSYETVGKAFTSAIRDPLVKAVMFQVDSPGGTTNGCFELADAIYNARGDKPIWGCADDMAGSAAYALISSCDRVFASRTAAVGSIGVFALHCDQSQLDEKVGAKYTYIFAGDKKVDGNPHEPLSRTARKDMQVEVDRQYEIFVTTVARNRDLSRDKVRGTEAGVLFGAASIPLLADAVGTFDDTLAELGQKVNGNSRLSKSNSALASKTDVGDNVSETSGDQVDSEGVDEMALSAKQKQDKQVADDLAAEKEAQATLSAIASRRTAAKKPAPEPEPDDDDEVAATEDEDEQAADASADCDDDMPDDKKGSKGGKKKATVTTLNVPTGADRATEIAELCAIAGMDDLTGKYIRKGYSVEQVRSFLQTRRAKLSAENPVRTQHSGGAGGNGGSMSTEQLLQQARTNAAASGGTLSTSKALEQLLAQNPDVYENYDEERRHLANAGSRKEWQAYVTQKQTGYMRALGLSSTIDDVPVARQM